MNVQNHKAMDALYIDVNSIIFPNLPPAKPCEYSYKQRFKIVSCVNAYYQESVYILYLSVQGYLKPSLHRGSSYHAACTQQKNLDA